MGKKMSNIKVIARMLCGSARLAEMSCRKRLIGQDVFYKTSRLGQSSTAAKYPHLIIAKTFFFAISSLNKNFGATVFYKRNYYSCFYNPSSNTITSMFCRYCVQIRSLSFQHNTTFTLVF